MITDRGYVGVEHNGLSITSHPTTRERAEAMIAERQVRGLVGRYAIIKIPSCRCCGEPAWPNLRCSKHQDRNPCAVEGCKKTARALPNFGLSDHSEICADHWRRFVPARSKLRRAYHRHFARAKRYGWTPESAAAFRRFWGLLVGRVRRQATEGTIDEAEIARLFGWDTDQ